MMELLTYNPKYTARTPKIKVSYNCLKMKVITDNDRYKRKKIIVNDKTKTRRIISERYLRRVFCYIFAPHLTSHAAMAVQIRNAFLPVSHDC